MTIDAALLREAREVLQLYSTPAQAMIKQNLYGPREARFAGAIVENSPTVVAFETELLKNWQTCAWEQISRLCDLLQKTTAIIEEHIAGDAELLKECEVEIATADDFRVVDADADATLNRQIFVVAMTEIAQLKAALEQARDARVPLELKCPQCDMIHVDQESP
jgi:hypothetical protein